MPSTYTSQAFWTNKMTPDWGMEDWTPWIGSAWSDLQKHFGFHCETQTHNHKFMSERSHNLLSSRKIYTKEGFRSLSWNVFPKMRLNMLWMSVYAALTLNGDQCGRVFWKPSTYGRWWGSIAMNLLTNASKAKNMTMTYLQYKL